MGFSAPSRHPPLFSGRHNKDQPQSKTFEPREKLTILSTGLSCLRSEATVPVVLALIGRPKSRGRMFLGRARRALLGGPARWHTCRALMGRPRASEPGMWRKPTNRAVSLALSCLLCALIEKQKKREKNLQSLRSDKRWREEGFDLTKRPPHRATSLHKPNAKLPHRGAAKQTRTAVNPN
jgi:hypothetical protein